MQEEGLPASFACEKYLWKIKMKEVDLADRNKCFINKNLRPYYKVLWYKREKAHILGKINSFFISCDTIKTKISEKSLPLSITHAYDFGKYFPVIDLSPPVCSI